MVECIHSPKYVAITEQDIFYNGSHELKVRVEISTELPDKASKTWDCFDLTRHSSEMGNDVVAVQGKFGPCSEHGPSATFEQCLNPSFNIVINIETILLLDYICLPTRPLEHYPGYWPFALP